MQCPSCNSDLSDGTAICPECDCIIDKSFLGDGYTDSHQGQEATDAGVRPDPPPAVPEGGVGKKPRPARRSPQDTPVDSASAPPESLTTEASRIARDVEGFLKRMLSYYKSLGKPDKLTVGGALAMCLFSFFPWLSLEEAGSRIGLEVDGWFILLMGVASISLVHVRRQDHWLDKERFVIYAQVGAAVMSLLFLLAKMSSLGNMKVTTPELGEHKIVESTIEGGLLACFLGCLAVVAGALLVFKDKVARK